MTRETINLIIEWFGHIQQMATDRKTLTGAVMDTQHCLNEIAALASNSKQFVEEYRDEQESINEEELDRLAREFSSFTDVNRKDIEWIFKAGYRKAKKEEQ